MSEPESFSHTLNRLLGRYLAATAGLPPDAPALAALPVLGPAPLPEASAAEAGQEEAPTENLFPPDGEGAGVDLSAQDEDSESENISLPAQNGEGTGVDLSAQDEDSESVSLALQSGESESANFSAQDGEREGDPCPRRAGRPEGAEKTFTKEELFMYDPPCGGGYRPPPPPEPQPKPPGQGPAPWPQPPFPPCRGWPDPDCPCRNRTCPSCGWCESRSWIGCPPDPLPRPVCCSPCFYLACGCLLCCLCRR